MVKILLYIVLAFIAYDFSIHLVYFFRKEDVFLKRHLSWWPNFTKYGRQTYQTFWTLFWGIALLLLILALINY